MTKGAGFYQIHQLNKSLSLPFLPPIPDPVRQKGPVRPKGQEGERFD